MAESRSFLFKEASKDGSVVLSSKRLLDPVYLKKSLDQRPSNDLEMTSLSFFRALGCNFIKLSI